MTRLRAVGAVNFAAEQFVQTELENLAHAAATAQVEADKAKKATAKSTERADRVTRELARVTMQTRARHQPTITALVGEGFQSDCTLRRHASEWVKKITAAFPDDTRKQVQLAQSIAERLALQKRAYRCSPGSAKAADSIVDSLQYFFSHLRAKYHGRYPNDVRATFHAVSMVISLSGKASLASRARLVGVPRSHLYAGLHRWKKYIQRNSAMSVLRGRIRSDKIPDEHMSWIVNVGWLHPDVTRAAGE